MAGKSQAGGVHPYTQRWRNFPRLGITSLQRTSSPSLPSTHISSGAILRDIGLPPNRGARANLTFDIGSMMGVL